MAIAKPKPDDGYQATMFSTLDPDVELDDNIVFLGDSRLPSCLEELATASYAGIDCEFYEEGRGPFRSRNEINYWKAAIRLIQIGLPSGRVIITNLGGLLDDRERLYYAHAQVLEHVRRFVESRTQRKVGMALLTEYMMFRIRFGWRMRCMRDIQLMSQVIWAGVAAKGSRWEPYGEIKEARLKHDMASICARLGIAVDKREQASDWAGIVTRSQFNYAARDTKHPIDAWIIMSQIAKADGLSNSIQAELDGQPPFCECEFNGLPVDEEIARADLLKWQSVRDEFWRPFRETFPGVQPTAPHQVAEVLGEALDVRVCGGCGREFDPLSLADHRPWQRIDVRCAQCNGPKENFIRKNERSFFVDTVSKANKVTKSPRTADENLIPYESIYYVKSLLEGRATSSCLNWLNAVVENMWGGRIRTDFRQIAGGFQEHGNSDGSAGMGMGRSAAGRPVNTQNPSNLQPTHEKAGAPSVRNCIRAPKYCTDQPCSCGKCRSFGVFDLSQSHLRIATQASQDPQMLQNYRAGIDAHLALSHKLMVQKGHANLTFEDCLVIYADKKHPTFKELKTVRNGSKNITYGSLNMQGGATLKRTAETAHEPVYMTIEEATERRNTWREVYSTLYQFQRDTIKGANRHKHRFASIGVGGEYGEVRALTGRRLFLIKNWNVPRWENAKGGYSVKGTDCVSAVWMMTEADVIKYAGARILENFDEHPEWEAEINNCCHDEWDVTWLSKYDTIVAPMVQRCMDAAMVWAGIVDIPVNEPNFDPLTCIKANWSSK